jgi:hypothetical protein
LSGMLYHFLWRLVLRSRCLFRGHSTRKMNM